MSMPFLAQTDEQRTLERLDEGTFPFCSTAGRTRGI
jgi:hypothetical protein